MIQYLRGNVSFRETVSLERWTSMYTLTDEEFEAAVQDAIDSIPDEFLDELENVAIIIAEEPEEEDF